ncbi:MAG: hypothetical protein A4S09_13190 [Proteobacteria bacterium SG_bin7]|nr:MAG: hypothetical protein A4S09_13190 [Proteobacteria bacterium SG_bin7]
MDNNAFFNLVLGFLCIGFLNLLGCADAEIKDTEPPKQRPEEINKDSTEDHVERVIRKLKPHLTFIESAALNETLLQYRKIYSNFLNRNSDQSLNERLSTLDEMVDESIQTLSSKDAQGKKCVIDRDFLSAEMMPLVGEIESMYKRHLNKVHLPANEISGLKLKVKNLNELGSRIQRLCKPYRDTLRLLNDEARLDAAYILNGGSAPGKAVPDQDSEVDDLLNDGNSLDKSSGR